MVDFFDLRAGLAAPTIIVLLKYHLGLSSLVLTYLSRFRMKKIVMFTSLTPPRQ